jgi:hypothetical protein
MHRDMDTKGYFYTTFCEEHPNYHSSTKQCAERTIDDLLKVATTSDHPGIMLGKVQSGKTRAFVTALALAFDNGFDIAIVLTKNSVALVEQTLKRLRADLDWFLKERELEIYKSDSCPTDFTSAELEEAKLILVANKQKDQLTRLKKLFMDQCPAMSKKQILIIDDEADNVSIGYKSKRGLIEANSTALQISDLRANLPASSFLQVTATPYSLYLQPDEISVNNAASFMPVRPAFTQLVPVGPDYIGGDTYFAAQTDGASETVGSMIHFAVDPAELIRLKAKDRRSYRPDELLTTNLYKGIRNSIVTFLVGGTIQRINGQAAGESLRKLRYSFLLHTQMSKPSHQWQEELVSEIIARLQTAAAAHEQVLTNLVRESYNNLLPSLQLDKKPVPEFDIVNCWVRNALTGGQITITKVNSDAQVANLLDENGELRLRTPFCFFIGGQAIDRGVTLSNLLVFFYGRDPNTQQQDTVLQHSRMYGYRRKDLAVTRFFTTPQIRNSMARMDQFDTLLRDAIEAGGSQAAVQFIHKSSDGQIIPCSPQKILASSTQTLRPRRRILPIGFQSGYATGAHPIAKAVEGLDREIAQLCGFDGQEPQLVDIAVAGNLLRKIESTLRFEDDDAPEFSWETAQAVLRYLSTLTKNPTAKGKVYLWATRKRDLGRFSGKPPFVAYSDNPDSKNEKDLADTFAIDTPILFLIGQKGEQAKGWRGTPFFWPVIRAQTNMPSAVYTAKTIS